MRDKTNSPRGCVCNIFKGPDDGDLPSPAVHSLNATGLFKYLRLFRLCLILQECTACVTRRQNREVGNILNEIAPRSLSTKMNIAFFFFCHPSALIFETCLLHESAFPCFR